MANDDGNRNRAGRYADVRDVAERDMRMARLAAQRKSHTEIARLEGCSERTVARGVKRALSAWRAQGGKEFADRILNDLEAVYAGLWEIVEDPGHKVSPAGKLVTGLDGEPVVNLDLRTDAYDKLRKVLADTRALLGTDAPKRSVQARVEVDLDSSCCRAGWPASGAKGGAYLRHAARAASALAHRSPVVKQPWAKGRRLQQ